MATSKVVYKGDLRTEMTHLNSGNIVITDAPVDNHGKGEAFSPTDLLATSLASCILTITGINARENNYNIDGAEAMVTKVMYDNPRRVGEIIIDFTFKDNGLSNKDKTRIKNIVNTCPVAKSLNPDIKIIINFKFI
ncbi:MAG: OsmC family protein [Marinilabiliales bacterium]